MSDDDENSTTEETFTRKQVRAMIASEVRKAREQFADYDELKKRAEAAEGEKGKIDQVLDKLAAAEQRAADAEAANMRREVADELGLSAKQARRLTGKTRDDLLADGREMIEDMGIKVKTRTPPTKTTAPADESDEDETDEQDETETEDETPAARPQARRPARPREAFRSGAPRTPATPDELDPAKLAAAIPRR